MLNDGIFKGYSLNGKRTLLWSNSSPSSSFASQTITLSSDDYDELECFFIPASSDTRVLSTKILKGYSGYLNYVSTGGSGVIGVKRDMTYVSSTSYTFGVGYTATGASAQTSSSSAAVPIYIYGIKY